MRSKLQIDGFSVINFIVFYKLLWALFMQIYFSDRLDSSPTHQPKSRYFSTLSIAMYVPMVNIFLFTVTIRSNDRLMFLFMCSYLKYIYFIIRTTVDNNNYCM